MLARRTHRPKPQPWPPPELSYTSPEISTTTTLTAHDHAVDLAQHLCARAAHALATAHTATEQPERCHAQAPSSVHHRQPPWVMHTAHLHASASCCHSHDHAHEHHRLPICGHDHRLDARTHTGCGVSAVSMPMHKPRTCDHLNASITLTEEQKPVNELQAWPTPASSMTSPEPNPAEHLRRRCCAAGIEPYPRQVTCHPQAPGTSSITC